MNAIVSEIKSAARAFRAGLWLQWQIESNWADPFIFAIYTLLRPISSAVMLVIMYSVVTQRDFTSPYFKCLFIGSALYLFAGAMMHGVSWGIIDDREHHKTLKYICISPTSLPFFLAGRGTSNFILAAISVLITMMTGIFFLKVQIPFSGINIPLLVSSVILGMVCLTAMGLLLAAISLVMAHHTWFIGDIVAGSLFLFSGAVFPLETLPDMARNFSLFIPLPWWIELSRRALIGDGSHAFPTLSGYSDFAVLGVVLVMAAAYWLASAILFPICFNYAREKGWLDLTSNY